MVPHVVWPNLLHFYVHFNQGRLRRHIEFSQDEMREMYSLYKAQITFTTHNIQNCLCLLKSWFVSWTVGKLLNSTIHWTHGTKPQPRFHCCQKINMALPWLRSIVANKSQVSHMHYNKYNLSTVCALSWGEKFTSPALTAPNSVPGRILCDKMCLANISH